MSEPDARTPSGDQATEDAKARLATAIFMSKLHPKLIAHDPTSTAPYGRDAQGNPRTRQQQETTEGKSPWASGLVGGETVGEAIGMNLYRHHQHAGMVRALAVVGAQGAGGPRAGGGGGPVAGGGGAMGPVQ